MYSSPACVAHCAQGRGKLATRGDTRCWLTRWETVANNMTFAFGKLVFSKPDKKTMSCRLYLLSLTEYESSNLANYEKEHRVGLREVEISILPHSPTSMWLTSNGTVGLDNANNTNFFFQSWASLSLFNLHFDHCPGAITGPGCHVLQSKVTCACAKSQGLDAVPCVPN